MVPDVPSWGVVAFPLGAGLVAGLAPALLPLPVAGVAASTERWSASTVMTDVMKAFIFLISYVWLSVIARKVACTGVPRHGQED